jgi:hypothetical protein
MGIMGSTFTRDQYSMWRGRGTRSSLLLFDNSPQFTPSTQYYSISLPPNETMVHDLGTLPAHQTVLNHCPMQKKLFKSGVLVLFVFSALALLTLQKTSSISFEHKVVLKQKQKNPGKVLDDNVVPMTLLYQHRPTIFLHQQQNHLCTGRLEVEHLRRP